MKNKEKGGSESIKVMLVDDHEILREGLSSLLRKYPDIEVVGQAIDGRNAISSVKKLRPDVVVMDISMPNLNGIDATRRILSIRSSTRVMALSTHSSRTMVVNMLRAGAMGYMLKDSAFTELVEGIRTIYKGKTFLCSKICQVVISDYIDVLYENNLIQPEELSNREREVLQLVAEGKTTKGIAEMLNLSVKTIESHRENVMKKLDIHNIADLTKYAIREGLTSA